MLRFGRLRFIRALIQDGANGIEEYDMQLICEDYEITEPVLDVVKTECSEVFRNLT